jgi:putative transposase
MARNSFSYGTKFLMDGLEHLVLRKEKSDVVVELLKYKQQKMYSVHELLVAFDEERLIFEDKGRRLPQVKQSIDQLLPPEKEEIRHKLKVLDPVIRGYYHKINLNEYLKKLKDEQDIKISRATFYNWKEIWDTYGDARYLLNLSPGPKGRRTEKEVLETLQKIMDDSLYNGPEIPYKMIYREYKKSLEAVNEMRQIDDKVVIRSFQTVWRIIKEKRDYYRQQAAREGRVAANLGKEGSKSVAGKPERPLQRVEMDWTPVDLYLVDPKTLQRKKPWLVYAIDVFSGNPLGFYITFEYPDTFAIKQCLLHCFLPKVYLKKLYPEVKNEWSAYGIPSEIVIDNASVNNSYELEEIFNLFGIDPLYPEVAAGHKKGTVERGLKTFNDIVHTLKGTSFSNIFERKHYDSEGEACITLQAFYYIAHIIFVDIISHNYSHSRIGGTPHQIWESGFAENPQLQHELPFSKRDLKIALCGGREPRKIHGRGVVLEGGWYYSIELMNLRTRLRQEGNEDTEVIVRFDYSDVKKVYVENPYDHSFIEAELDPNIIQSYEKHFGVEPSLPIPFQQIKAICLAMGREARDFDDIPIAEAIEQIKKIQAEQEKDKNNNYQVTLAQESAILDGIALSNNYLDNISPIEEPESFSYVGELTKAELAKRNKTGTRNVKDSCEPEHNEDKLQEQAVAQNIELDDDLPDYDVSYLGGV